jgi:predicted nucleic-acid-binding Zn-ribbon protein
MPDWALCPGPIEGTVKASSSKPASESVKLYVDSSQLEIRMFGSTKCVKCGGAAFKLQEITLHGAAYKMMAAQCSSCQTPFGLTDFFNVGQLLKNQEKTIANLEKKIGHVQSDISQIAYALNSLRR